MFSASQTIWLAFLINLRTLINLQPDCTIDLRERRNAAAILFYPGSLLGPAQYDCILNAFFEAGFTVAALHLPGHGLHINSPLFTFDQLLASGLTAEQWLLDNGYGPVIVSGHSQGGILTLAHAAQSSRIAAAFALGAVFPQLPAAIQLTRFAPFQKHRSQILHYLDKLNSLIPAFPVALPFYIPLLKLLKGREKPIIMGKGPARISYPSRYVLSLFTTVISPELQCPFWLISARNDALFQAQAMQESFNFIKGKQKKLIWLETGGHMAPFNPHIANFITGVITAACSELGLQLTIGTRK